MTVKKKIIGVSVVAAGITLGCGQALAQITIDNGISGDGAWSVESDDAGDSRDATIDPTGALGPTEVVYDFFTYIDVGSDGSAVRLADSVSSPAALSGPNQVSSSGSFAGPNGTVNWTSAASIAPGSPIYDVVLTFTSSSPFGDIQVINYFDEDVLGNSDDVLVVIGTPGSDDFQLLTVDDDEDVGVSHAASYSAANGMSYNGWAADEYSDLQSAIEGVGATYSVTGVIDTTSLPPYSDARFPANDAYGPEDITNAFAFTLDPGASSASVTFSLGGSPDAAPPVVPPTTPGGPRPIPTLGPIGLGLLVTLIPLIVGWRRRTAS
jgi:hypothetical protein